MSSPWGRCQVWHQAGHHQDRLHRDWILVPGSSHHLCPHIRHKGQVSSWQAAWHADRGRRATVTPLSECHVTVWHPLSREAWHMLGHDCDLQTDQTLGEAPRAAISAFYHQHRQGELASDTEYRAQGFWGRCGSNSIKECPLFHREQLCQNHQNQINQYEPEHILRPVPIILHIGHMCGALCEAVISSFSVIWYQSATLSLPPLPCLAPLSYQCIVFTFWIWVIIEQYCGHRLLL